MSVTIIMGFHWLHCIIHLLATLTRTPVHCLFMQLSVNPVVAAQCIKPCRYSSPSLDSWRLRNTRRLYVRPSYHQIQKISEESGGCQQVEIGTIGNMIDALLMGESSLLDKLSLYHETSSEWICICNSRSCASKQILFSLPIINTFHL